MEQIRPHVHRKSEGNHRQHKHEVPVALRLASRDSWPEGVGPPDRVTSWHGGKQALCPSRQCWAFVFTVRALIPTATRLLGHIPLLNTPLHTAPQEKLALPGACGWLGSPRGNQGAPREGEGTIRYGAWEPWDHRRGVWDGDRPRGKAVLVPGGARGL